LAVQVVQVGQMVAFHQTLTALVLTVVLVLDNLLLVLVELLTLKELELVCNQVLHQVDLVTMVEAQLLALLVVAVAVVELVKLDEAEFQVLVDLDIFHTGHSELVLLQKLVVVLALEELVDMTTLVELEHLQYLAITV
jgi:hypothetical protein